MTSMHIKTVRSYAPATVANLSCGFDVLGLCLSAPGDTVEISPGTSQGIELQIHAPMSLPEDPSTNCATVPILAMAKEQGISPSIKVSLYKDMPLSSGMGSSAASAVAGAMAFNEYLGRPYSKHELIRFAMEGERIACGAAHCDNVAPCLLGGISLVQSLTPLSVISLPVPDWLHCTVAHPHIELSTQMSRSVVPQSIPIATVTQQMGYLAAFVHALHTGERDILESSLHDLLATPGRAPHIPLFELVSETVGETDAIGTGISGSGPSVFVITDSQESSQRIHRLLKELYGAHRVPCDITTSKVNLQGATAQIKGKD